MCESYLRRRTGDPSEHSPRRLRRHCRVAHFDQGAGTPCFRQAGFSTGPSWPRRVERVHEVIRLSLFPRQNDERGTAKGEGQGKMGREVGETRGGQRERRQRGEDGVGLGKGRGIRRRGEDGRVDPTREQYTQSSVATGYTPRCPAISRHIARRRAALSGAAVLMKKIKLGERSARAR